MCAKYRITLHGYTHTRRYIELIYSEAFGPGVTYSSEPEGIEHYHIYQVSSISVHIPSSHMGAYALAAEREKRECRVESGEPVYGVQECAEGRGIIRDSFVNPL